MAIGRRTVLGFLASMAVTGAQAAPRSRLLDRHWATFGNGGGPDNRQWGEVLRRGRKMGSDGIARFDYGGVDAGLISAYIRGLEAVDPTGINSSAAFAYWVNLYNAATVQVVQQSYPVASIRDIGGGLFSSGPWRSKVVTVQGQKLSLDDIEHGILRPVWRDARVHYAVNCAAIGCPNLAAVPYEAGSLSAMLDKAARDFVNHPRGVDVNGAEVVLSSIYDWYGKDFGGSSTEKLAHIEAYANEPLRKALSSVRKIGGYQYDWALNDT